MSEMKLAVDLVLPDIERELLSLEEELKIARSDNVITDLSYYDDLRSRISKLKTITYALGYRTPKVSNLSKLSCPRCKEKLELLSGRRVPVFCPVCGQMIDFQQ